MYFIYFILFFILVIIGFHFCCLLGCCDHKLVNFSVLKDFIFLASHRFSFSLSDYMRSLFCIDIKYIMGQGFGSRSDLRFQDWQPHSLNNHLYINSKTGQEVQCHLTILNRNQQAQIKKRVNDHHNFIVKILHYEAVQKNKQESDQMQYYIITDKLEVISSEVWVPTTSALSILKGFRRLSSSYGNFAVSEKMIKVNNRKQVQVWINQFVDKNQIDQYVENQQKMLADICQIVMKFDWQQGCFLQNTHTFNEAINALIHRINAGAFISPNLKKQDKNYATQCFFAKNHFRATKETEDGQIKGIEENEHSRQKLCARLNQKKEKAGIKPTIPRNPTYIALNSNQTSKTAALLPRKSAKKSNSKRKYQVNFTYDNNTIERHPTSTITHVSHADRILTNKFSKTNQEFSLQDPQYPKSTFILSNHAKIVKDANKFKEILHQNKLLKGFQSSMNNLHINEKIIQRSDLADSEKIQRDKSQANSQRNPKNNPGNREPSGKKLSILSPTGKKSEPRTKTQQFYFLSKKKESEGAPRFKTNILPTTSDKHQLTQNLTQFQRNQSSIYPYTNAKSTKNISGDVNMLKAESPMEGCREEDGRYKKMNQIEKIKEEMSGLGIVNNMKNLKEDRSLRDLLVKMRIEQKSKKHEDLKNAISKLLKQ